MSEPLFLSEYNSDGPFAPGTAPGPIIRRRVPAQGMACRVLDKGIEAVLNEILADPRSVNMRRRLNNRAIKSCNDTPRAVRNTALVASVVVAGVIAAENADSIKKIILNRRYKIGLPIEKLGAPGSMEFSIRVNDGHLDEVRIDYTLRF